MKRRRHTAFSLVEVVLALGIVAFTISAVLGVLSVGLSIEKEAAQESQAANIASAVIADLRSELATQGGAPISKRYAIALPAPEETESGKAFFTNADFNPRTSATGSLYRVTVTARRAASAGPVFVHIHVCWPALADPDPALAPTRFSACLETLEVVDSRL